jgi:hypothetical protein
MNGGSSVAMTGAPKTSRKSVIAMSTGFVMPDHVRPNAEGLVITGATGGQRNVGGNLQNPRVLDALRQKFTKKVQLQQTFLDAGAVAIEANEYEQYQV